MNVQTGFAIFQRCAVPDLIYCSFHLFQFNRPRAQVLHLVCSPLQAQVLHQVCSPQQVQAVREILLFFHVFILPPNKLNIPQHVCFFCSSCSVQPSVSPSTSPSVQPSTSPSTSPSVQPSTSPSGKISFFF